MIHHRTLSLLQEALEAEFGRIFQKDVAVAIDHFLDGVVASMNQKRRLTQSEENDLATIRKNMQETVKYKAILHVESMLKGIEKQLIDLSLLLEKNKHYHGSY